jgi:adenosylcobinamide-phosphate synthase
MAASIAAALLVERAAAAAHPALGLAAGALIVWASVAPRDLARHALRVKAALEADLAEGDAEPRRGRAAVAMLVGRDVSRLDYAGVARACVESVAESSVDGAAAPLFWALLLGPWAAFAYRAANTMDSMFGHKDGRYYSFGLVAARADDALNWVPARIAGLLACLGAPAVGGRVGLALRVYRRYRSAHESPNAGHPEAAYAGALGLRLGGPTAYAEGLIRKPWMLPEGRDAGPEDIGRALRLLALQLTLVSALPAAALLAAA